MKTKNKKKQYIFSREELVALLRLFLDKYEADLSSDFRPEEPLWRKLLAERQADFLIKKRK